MFAAPRAPRNLEACLRDLRAGDAAVRASAASDLGRHGGGDVEDRRRAIDGLVTALRDGAGVVRGAAATALADLHDAAPLDDAAALALVAASQDPSPHVRQMAVAALGEIGGELAAPRLEAALADEEAEVRFQAVIAYPRHAPDAAAAVTALENATRDVDPIVAHIALRMAEEVGEKEGGVDPRILRRARALLAHDAPMVQLAAAIVLARGGEKGGEALIAAAARGDIKTPEGADEAAAIELAGELQIESARVGLTKRAYSGALGMFTDRFKWHARVALARMGDERARGDILKDLDAWDPNRRTLAVAAAGRARMTEVEPQLVAMRRDGRADANALDEALRALAEERSAPLEGRAASPHNR